MGRKRDTWIDNVKAYACVLVVLGHFFQSMISSGIIKPNFVASWFDQTIYYFHVPLFFICSGFLYQKYSCVLSFKSWKINVIKKLLALGVPYFVFSTVTWTIKVVFSGSVNNKADGFLTSIFLKPISPFWYLYALFFIFLLMPTLKSKKYLLIALIISLVLKFISFLPFDSGVYAVNTVLDNEIWFVIGMCLAFFGFPKGHCVNKGLIYAGLLSMAFISVSIVLKLKNIHSEPIGFVLGLVGCAVTVLFVLAFDKFDCIQRLGAISSQYTMPVFLMHTLCAATWRSVLLKIGIFSGTVHIITGLIVSFAGPVVIAMIMMKFKWLDFLIYPNKYIKFKK